MSANIKASAIDTVQPENQKEDGGSSVSGQYVPGPPVSVPFFRSTRFQALVIAAVFFCGPGMYGALNALGAGGLRDVTLVNTTSGMSYGMNFVFALLTGVFVNIFGERLVLSFGVVGFSIYAGALYCNSQYGTTWFLYFSSAIQGVCTALLWVVQAAIMLAYPELDFKGRFIAIWYASIAAGNLVGGIIALAFNTTNAEAGAISTVSYIPLIAIAALGPFLALLLSLPHQVIRRDGVPVKTSKMPNAFQEAKRIFSALGRKEMLFLLPLFIYSQWFLSYQSTFTATYHSLRGRALIGFLSSVFGLAGTFTSGSLLDVTSISRPKKFRALFLAIYTIYTSFWIGVTVVQWHYSKTHPIGLDWTDGEYYASFIFLLLWGFVDHAFQVYMYALVGTLSEDIDTLSRYTALLKAVNTGGVALGYGVQLKWSMMGSEAFAFGLWIVQIIPTWLVVRKVGYSTGAGE